MNKSLFISIILATVASARAGSVLDAGWTVNTAIPQGSPVGITTSQTFSSLPNDPIFNVDVTLDISGGYNGGLYGYLVLQDAGGHTATEILLNRVGTSASNPFGSSGSGFDVTLSDSGTVNGSIHDATGDPTGIWQPDSTDTLGGTFGGLTPNGTWTLFLADEIAGGGTSTLQSWALDINEVPDALDTGLISGLCALLALAGEAILRHQRKRVSAAR